VIHKSLLYANVTAAVKEFPDGSVEQLEISEEEMKRLQQAVWVVKRQYDPWEASEALLRVSNTLYKGVEFPYYQVALRHFSGRAPRHLPGSPLAWR